MVPLICYMPGICPQKCKDDGILKKIKSRKYYKNRVTDNGI